MESTKTSVDGKVTGTATRLWTGQSGAKSQ